MEGYLSRREKYFEIGLHLTELAENQAEWSRKTFGPDNARGPVGPLKHLEKEAKEAQEAPDDIKEYSDLLILLLDSSRRAGFTPLDVIKAAQKKMEENRSREWPTLNTQDPNAAIEHVRK